MADRTFTDLVTRVTPSVPGCPQVVVEEHLRNSAIEACERTLAFRFEQPTIKLTSGVAEYNYETPSQTEVHAILTARVNDNQIKPVTLEQLHDLYPKWPDNSTDELADPRFVTQLDPDNFALAPIPDSTTTYDVDMLLALKPLRSATDMDKTVLDELEDVVVHGALQQLLVLPEKSWSDRELAAYHAKQFLFKLSERRARTNLGAGRASMSIQMRPLA